MITPTITYNDFDAVSNPYGGPQTLQFNFPPTGKPFSSLKAKRVDTFSTANARQSIFYYTSQQWPITVEVIRDDGEDAPAWKRFIDFAVAGGRFNYFPDSGDVTTSFPCFLVETDAALAYSFAGVYSFTGTFQKEVLA